MDFKRPLSDLFDKTRMLEIKISQNKYMSIETIKKTLSTPEKNS
jgi:hypothetical protein